MSIKSNKRSKIPANIESDVMFLSNLRCCIDNKRGDHIHHIDGDSSNNNINNLALLCFECHDNASITNSLRKKLSPMTIVKFRDHHYKIIEAERNLSISKISSKVNIITFEDIVHATNTSLVLFEITKIKGEYYESGKMDRNDILNKLMKYTKYTSLRVSYEIFSFLQMISYETRSGLPKDMIFTIYMLIQSYFPSHQKNIKASQINEIGKLCISIATTIIYDSSIYTNNFAVMRYGYGILKFIYRYSAVETNNKQLKKGVMDAYTEMQNHLNRPERNDLDNAKSMLNIFKKDLADKTLVFPVFPDHLYKLIQQEK